jgi:hypothetical protein
MVTQTQENRNPIWWTTIIVAISTTIIGTALRMLTGAISSSAQEPAYFPLLFLFVAFVSTLFVVMIYGMILPQLTSNWMLRGLLAGIFLFIMGDLPYALITGYGTDLSGMAARNMAIAAFVNRLINGCVLTYTYQWFSKPKDS